MNSTIYSICKSFNLLLNRLLSFSIKLFSLYVLLVICGCNSTQDPIFYTADNAYIQYTGRVDFTNKLLPRFWSPGVYAQFSFEGDSCEITVYDELPWENSHNYLAISIDNQKSVRLKLTDKVNRFNIGENLKKGKHKVTICKSTEAGIGYIEFVGVKCQKLLEPEPKPERKIEFYGNSITCGTGSDTSVFACDSGEWHDKNNAYLSYGPITSRSLNAQWMLSSVSGIGMVHSCCDLDITMPQVFDKMNMRGNKISWDFSNYQPDVVTIALGQNDGIQDSTFFCSNYVEFLFSLREKYPLASIICLNSPMASDELNSVQKPYIASVVSALNNVGDENVYSFFFSRSFNSGCDDHPDWKEHILIAEELTDFIQQLKNWN